MSSAGGHIFRIKMQLDKCNTHFDWLIYWKFLFFEVPTSIISIDNIITTTWMVNLNIFFYFNYENHIFKIKQNKKNTHLKNFNIHQSYNIINLEWKSNILISKFTCSINANTHTLQNRSIHSLEQKPESRKKSKPNAIIMIIIIIIIVSVIAHKHMSSPCCCSWKIQLFSTDT